jgi:hypothetical protein
MHQPQIRKVVRAPAFLGHHMMEVESLAMFQVLVTDGTEALLPLDEWPPTKFGRISGIYLFGGYAKIPY